MGFVYIYGCIWSNEHPSDTENQQKTAKKSRKMGLGISIPPAHHLCQGYQLIHPFDELALDNGPFLKRSSLWKKA